MFCLSEANYKSHGKINIAFTYYTDTVYFSLNFRNLKLNNQQPYIKKKKNTIKKKFTSVFIHILYMVHVYVVGLSKSNTELNNKLFHTTRWAS